MGAIAMLGCATPLTGRQRPTSTGVSPVLFKRTSITLDGQRRIGFLPENVRLLVIETKL